MLRGIEARGSEHFCLRIQRKLECARTLGVPRALGTSRRADKKESEGLPGADTRIRAMTFALARAVQARRWLVLHHQSQQ